MKIVSKRSAKKTDQGKRTLPKGKSEGPGFLERLKAYESNIDSLFLETEEITTTDFENLAGIIEQLGITLSENPTTENFLKYKNHIKIFLRLAKENSEILITQRGYRKAPVITIQAIDRDLEELTQSIMNQEKNRLKYLKLTANIKGLLLDLIL